MAYILSKYGCMHPFRISRILVLANWEAIEKLGRPITRFRVEGFEAGFAVPEIDALKDRGCFRVNREKRCLEYTCSPPSLDPEEASIIDAVVEKTRNLDDIALNRLVVRDPRYRELLERGGFV